MSTNTQTRLKPVLAATLLLGLLVAFVGLASPAAAHHPALTTAEVECSTTNPGGWTVSGVSTAWVGSPSQRVHNNIDIYWGPESVDWPQTSATVPGGAILGDEGTYTNDPPAEEPDYSFPFTFEVPATFEAGDTIEVISFANGPWGNGVSGNQWSGEETGNTNGTPVSLVLPSVEDCLPDEPELALGDVIVCADGGISVTITNTGDAAGTATVTPEGGDPVQFDVPARASRTEVVPVAEGASFTLTFAGDFTTVPEPISGVRNCEEPAVTVQEDCAEGGIVVTLTNEGPNDTVVTVDGEPVTVPGGGTATVVVERPEGPYTFDVVGDGLDETFTGEIDCVEPGPVVSDPACAAGGINVALSNTGTESVTFLVESPALEGGQTEVTLAPDASDTVLIPLAEEATTDITVTAAGEVLLDETVTRDCEQTLPRTIVPDQPTPTEPPAPAPTGAPNLPRTGSGTDAPILLAGLFLLAGGAFVVAEGRQRRLTR